jgi:hypothetical protein
MRVRFLATALAGLIAGCVAAASAASAATVVTFEAKDFTPYNGTSAPAPFDTVSGTISLDFDPTQTYPVVPGHVLSYSFSAHSSGGATFDYNAPASDILILYQPHDGLDIGAPFFAGSAGTTDDFYIGLSLTGNGAIFAYANAPGDSQTFASENVTFSITPPLTATTPIPGSLLMLGTGLAAMGGLGLRRRHSATVAIAA